MEEKHFAVRLAGINTVMEVGANELVAQHRCQLIFASHMETI